MKTKEKMVKPVDHAFKLLFSFCDSDSNKDEFSITELSNNLKLHKNNIFRILATFRKHKWIEQNQETEEYRLGTGAFAIGQLYISKIPALNLAKTATMEIMKKTGECVHISIFQDMHVIYIDVTHNNQSIGIIPRTGKMIYAHATATGKMFLSALSSDAIDNIYKQKKLFEYRTETITSLPELKSELELISKRGYATEISEFEEDVNEIAMPIIDHFGNPLFCISITGPSMRINQENIETTFLPILKHHCDEISGYLGSFISFST